MATSSMHMTGLNGALVKQMRAERAAKMTMTMDDLSEAAGIPKRTLVRYLNGERPMTVSIAESIAKGLGIDFAMLVSRATSERQEQ